MPTRTTMIPKRKHYIISSRRFWGKSKNCAFFRREEDKGEVHLAILGEMRAFSPTLSTPDLVE